IPLSGLSALFESMIRPSVSSRSTKPEPLTAPITPETLDSTAAGRINGAASSMYFVTMVSPNSSSSMGCSPFCSLASSSCGPKDFRKQSRHSATGRSCAVSVFWRKLWAMVSWNALPNAVAAVPGSLRSRRYRNIHLAGQFKNCETWLGESTSARSISCPASMRHLLSAGRVNAQPDFAQIFAGELQFQAARGRIALGRRRHVHRCCQCLQQELPVARYQKTFGNPRGSRPWTISVCRRRPGSAAALSRHCAVRLLLAPLRFSISASVCRKHPLDGAPRSVLLLRLRNRKEFATSDSELVDLLLDDGWDVHHAAIGERVEDLITVLPRHFLAIVVLQCDVDGDVGLKLNFIAHLTRLLPSPRRTDARDEALDRSGRA